MKQKLAFTLAICMMLQGPFSALPAYGETNSPQPRSGRERGTASPSVALPLASDSVYSDVGSEIKGTEIQAVSADGALDHGMLQIEIRNFLGTDNGEFSLSLTPRKSTARRQEMDGGITDSFQTDWEERGGEEDAFIFGQSSVFTLSDIPPGTYDLALWGQEGPGAYGSYEQTVTIKEKMVTTLCLANDYPEYYGYEEEGNPSTRKYGVLMAGCFQDDDPKDPDGSNLEAMLEAVYGEDSAEAIFDLNGDGQVDLRDLEIFSKFYQNRQRTARAVETPWISQGMIQSASTLDSSVIQEGSIEELFSAKGQFADGGLIAGTGNQQEISAQNPVSVSVEFTDPVSAEGFRIVPQEGSLRSMVDGEVIFQKEDGSLFTVMIRDGRQQGGGRSTASASEAGSRASATALGRSARAAKTQATRSQAAVQTVDQAPLMASPSQLEEPSWPEDGNLLDSAVYVSNLAQNGGGVTVLDGEEDNGEPIQAKSIIIDFGGQIPVKKVTIRITKTLALDVDSAAGMGQVNLAEISRTEFLNDLDRHIPEPDLSIPDKLAGTPGDASFTVTWRRQANVTGYDVYVEGENFKGEIRKEIFHGVEGNHYEVTGLSGSDLCNNKPYTVMVRSINGDWRSAYSQAITVTPQAAGRPKPPEQIKISGGNQKLYISWKKMKSTDYYTLYYREKAAGGAFASLSGIIEPKAVLTGLKEGTEYEIYLTGANLMGTSDPSGRYSGSTLILEPPVTPNFQLINWPKAEGGKPDAIAGVSNGTSGPITYDEEFALVDGRFETVWVRQDWDAGCSYPGEDKAPIITFQEPHQMDTIVIIPDCEQPYGLDQCRVYYWGEDGVKREATGRLSRKTDQRNIAYYEFLANQPFQADKVHITLQTGYGQANRIGIADLKFFEYFALKDEILALYTDSLHMEIRADVTEATFQTLYEKLEYVDPVSGEKTPHYTYLKKELDTAKKLFEGKGDEVEVLYVDSSLTSQGDRHTGFGGGLNTWQPLGVAGLAGDRVILYVGAEGKAVGDPTNLTLIVSQYHGESSTVYQTGGALFAGPNEITIPKVTDRSDAEAGGQLYVRYDGAPGAEKYGVRVEVMEAGEGASQAARIPVLNLSQAEDEGEKRALVEAYVEKLEGLYASGVLAVHESNHGSCGLDFDEKNCIFGATDIVGDRVMFSLPSVKVLEGLRGVAGTSGDIQAQAQVLEDSLKAMDEMLTLFYQHKGLSDAADAGEKNRMPAGHINIRYQRMFEGAFMYAGGAHIGIEWGSASGMMAGKPLVLDENGAYQSGSYFGWGIAHEIGHEINEGAYAVAEVTNNYYAQLARAIQPDYALRWSEQEVLKKVTSGAKGPSSNGAVSLAMYWQLHLAYDMGEHYQLYDTYQEQFDHLFFARVDSYARDRGKAPSPGNVGLSLDGNKDNNLMRLSCAAAEKNILPFFERWGMEPDEGTRAYAAQFETETRGLWLTGKEQKEAAASTPQPDEGEYSAHDVWGSVSYDRTEGSGNQVQISLSHNGEEDTFLGYEVFRGEWKGGEYSRRPVGFVPAGEESFTDTIRTVNNRTFTYEAVGYDIWLRPTEEPAVLAPSVQVCHNGGLDSSHWSVDTNMTTISTQGSAEEDQEPSEENPDTVEKRAIACVIDGDSQTTFVGRTREEEETGKIPDPEIFLYLNGEETLTGLEYRLSGEGEPIGEFAVYISADGVTWERASTEETTFVMTEENGVRLHRVIFSEAADEGTGRRLCTYDASIIKLTAPGQGGKAIGVSEITLLGQTGDQVLLDVEGIGYLDEDYYNPLNPAQLLIPGGSLLFTGTYAGNPAYNTVLLWDEAGRIVGGMDSGEILSEQYIFAPNPEGGDLTNIASGRWVYYIPAGVLPDSASLPKKVRAELYRVDDALDQTGQRLVSSTPFVDLPSDLGNISIQGENRSDEEGNNNLDPAGFTEGEERGEEE